MSITALVTIVRITYFSKVNRLILQSFSLILIVSIILLIGLIQCFFILFIDSVNRKDGKVYSYLATTMSYIYLLQPITTYCFAFKYFESVYSLTLKRWENKYLTTLKYLFWAGLPLADLSLTITYIVLDSEITNIQKQRIELLKCMIPNDLSLCRTEFLLQLKMWALQLMLFRLY